MRIIFIAACAMMACTDLEPEADTCELFNSCAPPGDWSCIGQDPLPQTPRQQFVMYAMPVLEWGSRSPMAGAGLTMTACKTVPSRCDPMLPPYTPDLGDFQGFPLPSPALAAMAVPEGFDGFVRLEVPVNPATPGESFIPISYYPNAPVIGDATVSQSAALMLRGSTLTEVISDAFAGINDESGATAVDTSAGGIAAFEAIDCAGQPAPDVTISIDDAPDAIPFTIPLSRRPIPLETHTDETGIAGYANVRSGALQIHAFRKYDTEPYATMQAGMVASEATIGILAPPFLNTAR